jgi:catechol-2,3-dioxygenase
MTAKLYGVTLDCPDPAVMGAFYSKLASLEVMHSTDTYVGLGGGEGNPAIGFQQVKNYQPPQWPGQTNPQQFHLDFAAGDDLDAAEAEAISLGATRAADQPDPERWRVMLDPAGHPFCLAKM